MMAWYFKSSVEWISWNHWRKKVILTQKDLQLGRFENEPAVQVEPLHEEHQHLELELKLNLDVPYDFFTGNYSQYTFFGSLAAYENPVPQWYVSSPQ